MTRPGMTSTLRTSSGSDVDGVALGSVAAGAADASAACRGSAGSARATTRPPPPSCHVATMSSPPVTDHSAATRALERQRPSDRAGRRVQRRDPGLPPTDVHRLVGDDGDHLELARKARAPELLAGAQVDRLNGAVFHVARDDHPVLRHGECRRCVRGRSGSQRHRSRAVCREPDDHIVAACVIASGRHEAVLDDRRREDAGSIEIQVPLLGSVVDCQRS